MTLFPHGFALQCKLLTQGATEIFKVLFILNGSRLRLTLQKLESSVERILYYHIENKEQKKNLSACPNSPEILSKFYFTAMRFSRMLDVTLSCSNTRPLHFSL